jgi:hypothetical protein
MGTLQASRQNEIMSMSLEDMEKELAASGWKPKPEGDPACLGRGAAGRH